MLGKKTKNAVNQYKELQDILGDLQDGVVAADLLRRIAAGTAQHANENGFTYGLLYARSNPAPSTADNRPSRGSTRYRSARRRRHRPHFPLPVDCRPSWD